MSILGTDFLVSECLLLHIIKSSSYSSGRGGSGEWRLDWCFLLFFHFSRTLHFLLTSFLLLLRLQRAVSFSPLPPAMFLWCCYFCPSLSHTLPTVSVINYQDSSLWPYFACCMGDIFFLWVVFLLHFHLWSSLFSHCLLKSRDFANKGLYSQNYGFSSSHVWK